jgi:hypothetical protein
MGGPITAHAGRDHLRVLSSFSCKLSFRFTLDEKKLECPLRVEYLELREATAFSGDVRRFARLSGAPFDERNLLRILFPDPAPLVSLWLLDAFPALACSSVRILVTDAVMRGLSYPKYLETLKKELERCKLLIVPVGSGETRRIFWKWKPRRRSRRRWEKGRRRIFAKPTPPSADRFFSPSPGICSNPAKDATSEREHRRFLRLWKILPLNGCAPQDSAGFSPARRFSRALKGWESSMHSMTGP